jgi:hypothetical protein
MSQILRKQANNVPSIALHHLRRALRDLQEQWLGVVFYPDASAASLRTAAAAVRARAVQLRDAMDQQAMQLIKDTRTAQIGVTLTPQYKYKYGVRWTYLVWRLPVGLANVDPFEHTPAARHGDVAALVCRAKTYVQQRGAILSICEHSLALEESLLPSPFNSTANK